MKIDEQEIASFNAARFDLVFSKGKARLVDEIIRIKPQAIVIDAVYCNERGTSVGFILPKIQKVLNGTPVLLVNGSDIQHLDLLKKNLVYAVFSNKFSWIKLRSTLISYRQSLKIYRAGQAARHTVSVPCLVKKLGTSGLIQGKICDLSHHGMKIELDKSSLDWATGDDVRFSFKNGDRNVHFEGHGQLRWSVSDEIRPGMRVIKIGLEFTQLPSTTTFEFMDMINSARVNTELEMSSK
jgi:hypothetical protein